MQVKTQKNKSILNAVFLLNNIFIQLQYLFELASKLEVLWKSQFPSIVTGAPPLFHVIALCSSGAVHLLSVLTQLPHLSLS